MKIVLLERIEKLGRMGDVVTVKNGFGRNYLLPQKKALRATPENIAYFEQQRAALEEKSKDLQVKAEAMAKKVEKVRLIIIRQASETGHLYGSVTTRDIARQLEEHKITITHPQVRIDSPLKTVGVHDVKISLHPEVSTFIKVSIAPSEDEAKKLLESPEGIFKKEAETQTEETAPTESTNMDDYGVEEDSER